jgi:hypothetical protein
MPVSCKSETDTFFSRHSPKGMLDISDIPQGPGFMNTSFIWGFAPDMKWVGLAPTAAALTRIVAMGEALRRTIPEYDMPIILLCGLRFMVPWFPQVRVVLFELTSLLDASGHTGDLDQLFSYLTNCDDAKVASLTQKGAVTMCFMQGRYDVIHVPMGWVAVECAHTGMIIMGIRKSIMVDNKSAKASFQAVKKLYETSKPPKPTVRLDAVLAKMQA